MRSSRLRSPASSSRSFALPASTTRYCARDERHDVELMRGAVVLVVDDRRADRDDRCWSSPYLSRESTLSSGAEPDLLLYRRSHPAWYERLRGTGERVPA